MKGSASLEFGGMQQRGNTERVPDLEVSAEPEMPARNRLVEISRSTFSAGVNY